MKIKTPDGYESRTMQGSCELRKKDDGSVVLRGLGAVFGKLSENLGGFREIIDSGAFDDTDMSDVRGLFNHDSNYVLGRTASKTLRLKVVDDGLRYDIDVPDTRTIQDLVVGPVERGDVSQSSFGFTIARDGDRWDENDDGVLIRTITRINRLFDVSPVTFPAYPDATVGVRSMNEFIESRDAQHVEVLEHHKQLREDLEYKERVATLSGIR